DVKCLLPLIESLGDEREKHPVLFVPAVGEQASVTRPIEGTAAKSDERSGSAHGNLPSAAPIQTGAAMGSCSSQRSPPFVKRSGRSAGDSSRSSRPTSSSEWPSPDTAAVSIQLIPSSRAWRIVASESRSSCRPQPNDQPPPPT